MEKVSIIFFGSTADSVLVLDALLNFHLPSYILNLTAVVTQPARPVGRKQIMTPTPVETWAKSHNITTLNFPTDPVKPWLYQNEQTVSDTLAALKADLLVSACYGQKIPSSVINAAKYGGLNVHPSILPRWRGADPVPWAILSGDRQTGVTVITLSEKFDEGQIIAQKKIPLTDTDFSDPLRTKLFTLGAELLDSSLPDYLSGKNKGTPQESSTKGSYARRLVREDGFVPWELLKLAMNEEPVRSSTIVQFNNITIVKEYLNRYGNQQPDKTSWSRTIFDAHRAFSPWPGLWTNVKINSQDRRLKILSCHLSTNNLILDTIQLEGKKPVSFTEYAKAYLL